MILIKLLFVFLLNPTFANNYTVSSENCYSGKLIPSLSYQEICVGLVADSKKIPWSMPRKIVFYDPNTAFVSAMGSWAKNQGQIWRLNFKNENFVNADLIFDKLDRTHGLQIGPDNLIYFADATRILRFDPKNVTRNFEIAIDQLPDTYRDLKNFISDSSHPLKEFIFLKNWDLVINIGAPSNDCSQEFTEFKACHQRDSQAELRLFKFDPYLKTYSKSYTVIARGLRNSMGLLYNPKLNIIYQAENAADQFGTPDELNIIDLNSDSSIQDYGWPFCFDSTKTYTGYDNFKTFCAKKALAPYFLMPAHAAPLDIKYYKGSMFSELNNKILVSWHGHRPSGSKIAIYETDNDLHPLSKYSLNQSSPEMLIPKDWNENINFHPKGRPVGLEFDSNGAIYILDDKNNNLLVVAKKNRNEISTIPEEITLDPSPNLSNETVETIISPETEKLWNMFYETTLKKSVCLQCHLDIFSPSLAKDVLENMVNANWVNLISNKLEDQTLWRALTGHNGSKKMPPPPLSELTKDEISNLEEWILSF